MTSLGSLRRALRPMVVAVLGCAALAVPALAPAPASALPPCTIVGTAAGERLVGTSRADVICGKGGADVIYGYGADDTLLGDGGNDRLVGGLGSDSAYGGPGADTLTGADGADVLVGYLGNDNVSGGTGNDILNGEDGFDVLSGDGDADLVYGSSGGDRMSGGTGRDTISYRLVDVAVNVSLDGVANDGPAGDKGLVDLDFENVTGSYVGDEIVGDAGANVLDASHGDDVVRAGAGDDRLIGGDYRDELYAGDGDDVLRGGPYPDLLQGGAGADTMDGGTRENVSSPQVCDDDPADISVTLCTKDAADPVIRNISTGEPPKRPGSSFPVQVSFADVAGIDAAGLRVSFEGQPVAGMCPDLLRRTPDRDHAESYWTVTCTVPADAALGGYIITPWARDRLGHDVNPEGAPATKDASIPVVGTEDDTTGPQVTAVRVNATTPLTPGQPFRIEADVSDASGVWSSNASITKDNRSLSWCGNLGGTRVPGTSVTEGTWRFRCTVPTVVHNGVYTVSARAMDSLFNQEPPATAPATATFEVSGGSDDFTAPEVTSVAINKTSVTPGTRFTVSATLSDPSGVEHASVSTVLNGAERTLCDPITATSGLTAGTVQSGTWTLRCTVPQHVLNGSWQIGVSATDSLGNRHSGSTGPTAALEVTGGSDGSGPTIKAASASPTTVAPGGELTVTTEVADPTGVAVVGYWLFAKGTHYSACTVGTLQSGGSEFSGNWRGTCTVPVDLQPGTYTIHPYAGNSLGVYTMYNRNNGSNWVEAQFTVG